MLRSLSHHGKVNVCSGHSSLNTKSSNHLNLGILLIFLHWSCTRPTYTIQPQLRDNQNPQSKNVSWLPGLDMKCWQGPTHEVYLQQQKLQFVPQYETNHPPQPCVCCCLLNIFSQHGGDISDPVALEIHPVSAQSVVANSSHWMCCQGTRAVCMTEIPEKTETIPQHVPSQTQKTSDYIQSGL